MQLFGIIKLLPQLIKFAKILLQKYEVAEAKEKIRKQNEEVEVFIEQYEKDPEDALNEFWSRNSE